MSRSSDTRALKGRLLVVALAAAWCVCAAPAAVAADKWAVVVGIDQYQSADVPRLGGAVADARGIAHALETYAEFPEKNVFLLTSDGGTKPTKEAIMDALETVQSRAKREDLLVVFFAGHGVELDGRRLLLTYETPVRSSSAIITGSLAARDLMDELKTIQVHDQVLFIDACRDDPRDKTRPNVLTESLASSFEMVQSPDGGTRATLLSTESGQSAYEWTEKGRGFFSYYVEQGLSGEAAWLDNSVTLTSLIGYVTENVSRSAREHTGHEQRPTQILVSSSLVLVRPEKTVVNPRARNAPAATRSVYGIVKTADGTPLKGVAIRVSSAGRTDSRGIGTPSAGAPSATTDEDGNFLIDDLAADGTFSVEAQLPGYLDHTRTTTPAEKGLKLSFFMVRSAPAPAPPAPPVAVAAASPGSAPVVRTVPAPAPVAPPPPVSRAPEFAQAAYHSFVEEDFAEAEKSARAALAEDPGYALANAVLGNALAFDASRDKSKLAEARRFTELAIGKDPKLALAYNARGLALVMDGNVAAAQREFLRAASLDDSLSVAHANLAYTYFRDKRYADAEKSYRAAIKTRPDNAIPYNGLALVLNELHKYGDAAKACRDAIVRYQLQDANLGSFYVNLAVAQYQQGKQREALEAVARAKTLGHPTDPAFDVIERGPQRKK